MENPATGAGLAKQFKSADDKLEEDIGALKLLSTRIEKYVMTVYGRLPDEIREGIPSPPQRKADEAALDSRLTRVRAPGAAPGAGKREFEFDDPPIS